MPNVDVYHPAAAVPNAPSATTNRFFHRAVPARDVGGGSHEMLTVPSTTHAPVRGRRPVPRHDGQRPSSERSDALEDVDELPGRSDELPRLVVTELPSAEVRTQISHGYYVRLGTDRLADVRALAPATLCVESVVHRPAHHRLHRAVPAGPDLLAQ